MEQISLGGKGFSDSVYLVVAPGAEQKGCPIMEDYQVPYNDAFIAHSKSVAFSTPSARPAGAGVSLRWLEGDRAWRGVVSLSKEEPISPPCVVYRSYCAALSRGWTIPLHCVEFILSLRWETTVLFPSTESLGFVNKTFYVYIFTSNIHDSD